MPVTGFQNDLLGRYGPAALVTGASSGIGRAIATALASYGFDLVLVSRSAAVLETFAAELSARHAIAAAVVSSDLSDPAAVEAILARPELERVGLLVAAAGFGSAGRFDGLPIENELVMIDVNCRSVVALTHGLAKRFAGRGRGGIILFSSLVGQQGTPYAATYAATKAFIQSFGEALHTEMALKGVDVLVATPGPVTTGFGDRAGMTLRMADMPDAVAAAILRALGRQRQVTPGRTGRLLATALWPLPRVLRTAIMGRIMKGMIRDGDR